MIPAFVDPETTSPGEKLLFNKLANAPGTAQWTVLHSLSLPRHVRQTEGETDFVIVVPALGVLCLEVKAHKRAHRDSGGLWHLGREIPTARSPFRQAADAMHSTRRELTRHAPALEGIPFASAVAFTHADCDQQHPAEWHPWQLLDARALLARPIDANVTKVLTSAREHYRSIGKIWLADSLEPTSEQVDIIVRKLRPSLELYESRKTTRARTRDELLRFTEEQYDALDSLASVRRLHFNGPAGTGKTFLAMEAARRAAASGARVLLACYNRSLAQWLQSQAQAQGARYDVRTWHSYLHEIAGRPSANDNSSWWATTLPDLALERLLSTGPTHDVLVVDEAQDLLTGNYLDCMDASLSDGLAAGHWTFFSDLERQALYGGTGHLNELLQRAPDAVRFDLFTNCRNTPSVAEYTRAVAGLESGYRRILRPDNGHMPRTFFYGQQQDQAQVLASVFARLRNHKIEAGDVAVLSNTRNNPALCNLPADEPWRHRVDSGDTTKPGWVTARTVHSFKGLEAPVVILTGVDDITSEAAQAELYVALSRPTEWLIVIAHESTRTMLKQLATPRFFATEATA
ncbi:NERD domain-containing protein [Pseudonocardia sp. Cha107L01]|uniref:NERD domain-containing protein n=1 Tax=Pseudonocardia sp. Cha107L01 TaxID=3457576 RepID=UPI00403E4AB5